MKLLAIVLLLPILTLAYLALQAHLSKSGQPPALINGKLHSCPAKPNCVCSEYPDTSHSIHPLTIPADLLSATETRNWLIPAIEASGGQITQNEESYLAATFQSKWLGFVDDLELRIDMETRLVHIRSASRVGHSDFGVNQARVDKLIQQLNKPLTAKPVRELGK